VGAYYLDTSALAKRYTVERGREWMRRLTSPRAGNDILFSVLATIEVEVALSRKVAERAISTGDRDKAVSLFRRHLHGRYTTLPISDEVLQRARMLVRRRDLPHPLRTYDALHLATALTIADLSVAAKQPLPTFLAADRRLLAIAGHLGLPTENPEDHP
jgi:uncharacterized protein